MTFLCSLLLPLLVASTTPDPASEPSDAPAPASSLRSAAALASAFSVDFTSDLTFADGVDRGWLDPSRALSAECAGLLGEDGERLHVDVLARAVYSSTDSKLEADLGSDDFTGFNLTDGDVAASTFVGPWSARASVDLGSGGPDLEDAFVRWSSRLWGDVTVGRYKPFILRSSEADPEHLIFPTRTFLGSAFDRWDQGLEWHGRYDEFDWWLSAVEGQEGLIDENLYSARAEWTYYDENQPAAEGARFAPLHLQLNFGFAYWWNTNELDSLKNDGLGLDVGFTLGPYSFAAEAMRMGREARLRTTEEADLPLLTTTQGAQPYSFTLGRMLGEEFQVAYRRQNARDQGSTEYDGLGLSWFPVDAPFALYGEIAKIDRDVENGTLVRIGLSFGSSRHDEPRYPR